MTENKTRKKKKNEKRRRKVKKRRIIEWNSREKKFSDIGVFQTAIASSLLGWSGFH